MKYYCETHHLYHKFVVCPFCQREKNEKLLKSNEVKPVKPVKKQSDDKPIEITEDVLSKLKNHFQK